MASPTPPQRVSALNERRTSRRMRRSILFDSTTQCRLQVVNIISNLKLTAENLGKLALGSWPLGTPPKWAPRRAWPGGGLVGLESELDCKHHKRSEHGLYAVVAFNATQRNGRSEVRD